MREEKRDRTEGYRVILNILRVFLIVFVLDLIIGFVLSELYIRQNTGLEADTTYAIDKMDEEIVIIGSSRANHHYVPEIIEDSLSFSCFNAGRDGQYTFYYEALITSVLNRYVPELIILELNSLELLYSKDSYDRIAALLPYYNRNEDIKRIISLRSSFERLKLFSRVYPYNGLFLTMLQNISKKRQNSSGYKPIFKEMENAGMDTMYVGDREFDPIQIASLNRIVKLCESHKVPLVVVTSPALLISDDPEKQDLIYKLSKDLDFRYYEYTYHPYFMENLKLFADPLHLNDEGARIFTSLLVKQIKGKGILSKDKPESEIQTN